MAAPPVSTITLLIVEDNPGDARLIREALSDYSAHERMPGALSVLYAARLATALERLGEGGVDVVLLDLSLPDAQGLETLARVRGAAPATPVLVLTGHDDDALGARAVREGAQDYLVKGRVHGGVLWRTIRYAIERGLLQAEREALLVRERSARAEADAASRAKSEFLAMMSHEIRTPINAIVGYTQILELGIAGPITDEQRAHLTRMRASSTHLISLVSEVLDLAKVEAGNLSVERAPARVRDAIAGAMSLVAPRAAEQGILMVDQCGEAAGAEYLGDETRVRQILVNLLGNAVKFTDRGGRVVISCGTQERPDAETTLSGAGPWVRVRVEDTGIGIASEKLASVFEPFVQAESGHTRSRDGAGLGLAIARRLARLMSGDLTAASRLGEGSSFTLWLPTPATESPRISGPIAVQAPSDTGTRCCVTQLGMALQLTAAQIAAAFVRRMRQDRKLGKMETLNDAQLADHTATLLADVGVALVALAASEGAPSLVLEDSTAIERLIAERHGAQRRSVGWSEVMLRREFDLLREETHAAVLSAMPREGTGSPDEQLRLLDRFLQHAESLSLRRFRKPA